MLFSEPKIPQFNRSEQRRSDQHMFQCSSASRKFLNSSTTRMILTLCRVSVLFSEPKIPQSNDPDRPTVADGVSVLFSEPKIPQFRSTKKMTIPSSYVSVLFSEPKIPQCHC